MKIGVLGTGQVGGTIGRKLADLGYDVMLGSSHAAKKSDEFPDIRLGSAIDAAAHGELVVNALPGEQSLVVLRDCSVDGKILIDIGNYDSAVDKPLELPLGEAIQRQHPKARVVKTLNSVSAHLMVDPHQLADGDHTVFVASNDAEAKQSVVELLRSFGWQDILDLGDLSACRAMEQLIPLWMRLEQTLGGPNFNLKVQRQQP